jgi:3-(3-hydroxy-phenyl)propionate hydroxylase
MSPASHGAEVVPVVIVGAGPTGVTAATLLAQQGIDCLVLDRWENVYTQPRAVHLDDEIYRIIGRLGIADEFATISRPTRGMQLRDRKMRVLAEFRREGHVSAHGYPQANMFDQPELEALLRANLKRYPHATLRANSEVTDIVRIDRQRVQATFTDRVSGHEHHVEANYLLGCDGANSVVRASIGASMEDLKFQQRWLVVDVATAAHLDQWDGVQQICDPHRAATFMRIGETRYRWEFRLLAGETASDFSTMAQLNPLIRPWVEGIAPERLEIVRVAEYTFRAQLADSWHRDNIFLLGDAAHLTPPFIGQGMGAGIRDAMNLSWKLAGVINGWLPDTVLNTYEQERKPHVRSLIRLARFMGRAMTAGGELGNFVRRVVVPRIRLIPGLREKIVESATPALHRSALVVKPHRRPRLAGGICPNPVLADGKRLDALVGNRFAVIVATPLSRPQRDELARRGAVVAAAEPDSDLGRWLRSGHATAAVIRPDGTVLCAGNNATEICRAVPVFAPPGRTDA